MPVNRYTKVFHAGKSLYHGGRRGRGNVDLQPQFLAAAETEG